MTERTMPCFSSLPGHGHSPSISQALACLSDGGWEPFVCSGAQSSPSSSPNTAPGVSTRDSHVFQSEATPPAGVKLQSPNHALAWCSLPTQQLCCLKDSTLTCRDFWRLYRCCLKLSLKFVLKEWLSLGKKMKIDACTWLK